MGGVLGSCIGSCVGSCAIGACCKACSCKCISSPRCTNLMYCLILSAATVGALVLRYTGVDLNIGADIGTQLPSVFPGRSSFSFSICNDDSCKGYWAVYRVTFTLAAFFLCMMLLTACRCQFATNVHRGYWFAKIALILCTLVGTIFAPNDMFAYFAWVARFIAPLFLFYEVIIFIDFGYNVNSALIEKDERQDVFFGCENGGNKYKGVILTLAATLYALCFTSIGLFYSFWNTDCAFNTAAITITLLFGLLNSAISISKIAEHGSILTSSLVFSYSTWLCYCTIAALPEPKCNPQFDGSDEHFWQLATSIVITAISIAYIGYRAGTKSMGGNAMTGGETKPSEGASSPAEGSSQLPNDQVTVRVDADESPNKAAAEPAVEPESFLMYHGVMFVISMYMAMLLTDWGVPGVAQTPSGQTASVGYASAWLEMGVNWLICLLYLWTLVAPALLPDRDFS